MIDDYEFVENPSSLEQGFAARARRTADGPLRVRTITDRKGRRVPVMCADRRLLATFPVLRRGARLAEATANGSVVAWRTATSNRRGTVSVGRVVKRTVRRIRATRAIGGQLLSRDGRLTVAPNGDAAWALEPAKGTRSPAKLWAWPRGRRVKALPLDGDQGSYLLSILLTDDQHVFADGGGVETVHSYRPPTPGRCPKPSLGGWEPLGPWKITAIDGFSDNNDGGTSLAWTVVCDPASGRLLHVETDRSEYNHYCTDTNDTPRAAALGPWLVLEHRSTYHGGYCGGPESTYRSSIIDTVTQETWTTTGALSGPDAPARSPTGSAASPSSASSKGAWASVVLRNGSMAWLSSGASGLDLHLVDALGARVVGHTQTASLVLDDQLRWTDGETPRSLPITPNEQWQAATATLRSP